MGLAAALHQDGAWWIVRITTRLAVLNQLRRADRKAPIQNLCGKGRSCTCAFRERSLVFPACCYRTPLPSVGFSTPSPLSRLTEVAPRCPHLHPP